MAENKQNSRYAHHRWNTAGVTPSVPVTDDITSTSFSTTDIKRGEIAINLQDERLWFRSNFGVVEINTSSTFSSTPMDLQAVSDIGNTTTNKLNFPQWQIGDVDGTNNIYMDNSEQVRVLSTNPAFSGIVYGDDYSANFTNRSLVDKEYVDSAITVPDLATVLTYGNGTGTNDIYILPGQALKSGYAAGPQITYTTGAMSISIDNNTTANLLLDATGINTNSNLITGTSTYIKSINGGGKLELDSFGTPGSIALTTDNGGYLESYIFMNNSNIYLASVGGFQLGTPTTYVQGLADNLYIATNNLNNITGDRILMAANGTVSISSTIGIIQLGATTTIASNKSIKSANTGGQIDLDAYGIGGNVLITTDAGVEATPYIRMNTSNVVLNAATVSFTLESSNSRIQIGGPTGLLIGRCTTTEKTALPASNGMIVYDTTLNKFQGYENGSWVNLV
jgi:hypothetical protein